MASIPALPVISDNASLEELREQVAILQKTIAFALTGNLGSQNAYEFGNWLVTDDALISENGTVGFSTAVTGGNDIRIWAGDATPGNAAVRIYEDGTVYLTNGNFTGTITGGTITGTVINTAASGRRIVLNGNTMVVYNETGNRRISVNDPAVEAQSSITFFQADGITKAMSIYHSASIGSQTNIEAGVGNLLAFVGNIDFINATVTNLTINSVNGLPAFISQTNANKANVGSTTSSVTQVDHNHGIPPGTVLSVAGGGTVTWVASGGSTHSHTI